MLQRQALTSAVVGRGGRSRPGPGLALSADVRTVVLAPCVAPYRGRTANPSSNSISSVGRRTLPAQVGDQRLPHHAETRAPVL